MASISDKTEVAALCCLVVGGCLLEIDPLILCLQVWICKALYALVIEPCLMVRTTDHRKKQTVHTQLAF